MKSLQGQVAIITGAGSGIGAGIARECARRGINVVLCGRRLAPIEQVAAEVEAQGVEAAAIQADVAEVGQVDHLVEAAMSRFSTIDILVNNAGIGGGRPIHEQEVADWDRILAVNLRGPFLLARAVLPAMRAQRRGHIINISSESATTHYAGNGAYGVAKHGLNALSEYIQVENQELGIRVDTICPGMVVTEMTRDQPGLDHAKCLQPQDIAELVGWLLSRRPNIKIGTPVLIQTMKNPWQ